MDLRADAATVSSGANGPLPPGVTRKPGRKRLRVFIGLGVGVALLVLGVAAYWALKPGAPAQYLTTPLRQGDLSIMISATGSLQPVNQVDVGSEQSGIIESVLVEENDPVSKGQILAVLDTAKLRDQIILSQGALAAAEANLRVAEATQAEQQLTYDRRQALFVRSGGDYPSVADVDAARAALRRATAAREAAAAAIQQARAGLNTGRTNLQKATVRSPVAGVVLLRKAEPGQTVAASLQAPVLFTLAEDMRRMELHVDIDEADVGNARIGQAATFTVDAFPGKAFPASVRRVDYGSQTKDGVVTYTGVLSVDNSALLLRPGMTASADITAQTLRQVLVVPEAALRFQPPARGQAAPGLAGALSPRMPRLGAPQTRRNADAAEQQIWVLRNAKPVRIPVVAGASNGQETVVTSPQLRPGDAVITAVAGTGS